MILINSSPKDALKIFQPFLPISLPLGLGCLISVANIAGLKIKFIDEQIIKENIIDLIKTNLKDIEKPYIFGFSVLTIAFKSALYLSRELKRIYPDSIIIFGGVHPTAMPDETLSFPQVDIVVRGEGEKVLIKLYERIKNGKDYSDLKSISFRKDNKIIHNDIEYTLDNLDSYPPFPYHLFDPKRYDVGVVMSSRGCPYRCIFCSNRVTTGRRYRYRSSENIVEDLKMLYGKYGKKFVAFMDDNFLVNRNRVYDLIEKIKNNDLHKKMRFAFQARGDNTDFKLLQDLYASGFKSVFYGIETSSEKVMKNLKKDETVAKCIDAVRIAKKIGFHVSATFIYGLPDETRFDRINCVKMCEDLKIDVVRFNNATPYPGTELYELAKKQNRLFIRGIYENFLSVATFTENPFKKIPFSYVPEGSSEEEIRRDLLYSYFRFYLNYHKIINVLFKKGTEELKWFKIGETTIDKLKKIPILSVLFFMIFIKFIQLFYFSVINRKSAVSLGYFLSVFSGLLPRSRN